MRDTDELTENDVVDAVCEFLKGHGYVIESRCSTTQKGDDIVASGAAATDRRIHIEAKGATSARAGSARYGTPFDSAQVNVHVAETVFKAAQVLSRPKEAADTVAGIALPANALHKSRVKLVEPVLKELGVAVFWVNGDRTVDVASPWQL